MNSWARGYDSWVVSGSWLYHRYRREFADWIAAILEGEGRSMTELTILDVGCGTGRLLKEIGVHRPRMLVGLDLAEAMLIEAQNRSIRGGFARGLIEEPPFAPQAFDIIVASWTVHHLVEPEAFFRLVADLLRPDGWFFVLEYDGGFASHEGRGQRSLRGLGDILRGLMKRVNHRELAHLPSLSREFNPAHRLLDFEAIRSAAGSTGDWQLRREVREVFEPAVRDVLIGSTVVDRALARALGSVDHLLEGRRRTGYLQWIAGRRPIRDPRESATTLGKTGERRPGQRLRCLPCQLEVDGEF